MVFVVTAGQNLEIFPKMNHSKRIEDNVLIISIEGDLIGEESGIDLIGTVNESIDSASFCIIDINGIRYINSSGIGVLITILTKFRNKNGEVALVGPSESVKKLLIITKLNAIFNICENMEEAKKLLKK